MKYMEYNLKSKTVDINKYQNNGLDKNKQKLVNKILEDKENVILFSFGDSISDIPLLKVAKRSFKRNK